MLWTGGLVLVGFVAWAGARRLGWTNALRMWWTAVVLVVVGFGCVGLAFLADGDASLGLFYLGALVIGLSMAIGIPASLALWRQRNAAIWPPR